jgi:hypothetical protein
MRTQVYAGVLPDLFPKSKTSSEVIDMVSFAQRVFNILAIILILWLMWMTVNLRSDLTDHLWYHPTGEVCEE